MNCTVPPCRNYCTRCGKFYPVSFIEEAAAGDGIPRCTECGGIAKPDVVLYEEGLDEDTMENAMRAIAAADTLIVGGTSLAVYPAAGLLRYFRGEELVVINKQPTTADGMATLLLNQPIGQALGEDNQNYVQFCTKSRFFSKKPLPRTGSICYDKGTYYTVVKGIGGLALWQML